MSITFGIIDHLDRQSRPVAQTYRERLDLLRLYDEAGFYAFHLTEHHCTPLGLAPSPLIFLAAASQVTSRIKLVPLVLILPLYNPLRLAEEIAMVDHLSGGRIEFATGKGISPYELAYFGINHLEAPAIHQESFDVLMQALTHERLDFRGHYHKFFDVPIELRPLQTPHPPLWYATSRLQSAAFAAREKRNLAFLAPAERCRALTDQYRETWQASWGDAPLPRLGLARHVFVDRDQAKARERAAFGFAGWYEKFGYLWAKNDPRMFKDTGEGRRDAMTISGTPEQVCEEIARQMEISGCNYFIARFAYGDLSYAESAASLELFAEQVMPRFEAVGPGGVR